MAIPKKQPRSTLAPTSEDERWQQLRRCLHDTTLRLPVRAGGALVLLYGLPVSRVTAVRHSDLHTDTKNRTWLQVGERRLRLPPPSLDLCSPNATRPPPSPRSPAPTR
jgi:hypothetical protein